MCAHTNPELNPTSSLSTKNQTGKFLKSPQSPNLPTDATKSTDVDSQSIRNQTTIATATTIHDLDSAPISDEHPVSRHDGSVTYSTVCDPHGSSISVAGSSVLTLGPPEPEPDPLVTACAASATSTEPTEVTGVPNASNLRSPDPHEPTVIIDADVVSVDSTGQQLSLQSSTGNVYHPRLLNNPGRPSSVPTGMTGGASTVPGASLGPTGKRKRGRQSAAFLPRVVKRAGSSGGVKSKEVLLTTHGPSRSTLNLLLKQAVTTCASAAASSATENSAHSVGETAVASGMVASAPGSQDSRIHHSRCTVLAQLTAEPALPVFTLTRENLSKLPVSGGP